MIDISLNESIEKLHSIFLNIICLKPEERLITPSIEHLGDIKDALNNILKDNMCTDVLYTFNTDKPFFGVHVNPVMTPTDAITILATDEKVKLHKYQVELDSKLFDVDLTAEEIIAVLLHEISAMVDSNEAIDNVRALVDLHVLCNDDIISLRDSVNYSQLIIFALKDTLYKVSSAIFKEDPEELICNKLIQACELEDSLISAQEKITTSTFGIGEVVREPKTIILRWMFMVYRDIKTNYSICRYTLTEAKEFTGSRLEKMEIDKALSSIERIGNVFVESTNINKVLESANLSAVSEISLFKSLKMNGLKGIEDDLYEYMLRVKNCETEEDAIYILRCINTRLSILEDYLNNTPDLSEYERKRWEGVATKYRLLREDLAKKKIVNKKQYGLFFDYDKLDYLDKKPEDD